MMKHRFFCLSAMAFLLISTSVKAEVSVPADKTAAQQDAKAISLMQKAKLTLDVKQPKQVYEANEAISLVVTTNKEAYIYLLAPDNGGNPLVFPAGQDKSNKTAAGVPLTIPDFASDKAGVEKIIVVASTRPLSLKQDEPGSVTGSPSAEKQIRVASDDTAEKAVQEFDVIVVAKRAAQPSGPSGAETKKESVVFVNTDKTAYKTKDRLSVRYLATETGNLGLYVVGPDNSVTPLGSRGILTVEQAKLYSVAAIAEPPAGVYKVVAVFQKGKADEPSMEAFVKDLVSSSLSTKGLRTIEPPEAFSVCSFVIE